MSLNHQGLERINDLKVFLNELLDIMNNLITLVFYDFLIEKLNCHNTVILGSCLVSFYVRPLHLDY